MIFCVAVLAYILGVCSKRLYKWIADRLFFTFILSFLLESYLDLCLFVMLNFRYINTETDGDFSSVAFAFIFSIFILGLPILTLVLMNKYEEGKSYDILFEGLKKKSKWCLCFSFMFMLRRALFAAVLVFLGEYPMLQVIAIVLMSLLLLIYTIAVRPF